MSSTPFIPYYRLATVTADDYGKGIVFDAVTGQPTLQTLSTAGHTHPDIATLNAITSAKVTEWDSAYTASHGVNAPNSSHYLKAEVWNRSELYATCTTPGGVIDASWIRNLNITGVWNVPSTNNRTISGNVGIGFPLATTEPSERLHVNGAVYLQDGAIPGTQTGRIYNYSSGLYFGLDRINKFRTINGTNQFSALPTTSNLLSDVRNYTLLGKDYLAKCKLTSGTVDQQWGSFGSDPTAGEVILATAVHNSTINPKPIVTLTATEAGWKLYPTKLVMEVTSVITDLTITLEVYTQAGPTVTSIIFDSDVTISGGEFLVIDLSGEIQKVMTFGGSAESLVAEVTTTSSSGASLNFELIGYARRA